MPRIHLAVATVLVLGAVLAQSASALYIQTPLVLHAPDHADVGDDVSLSIQPENATVAKQYAGKLVRIVYLFDPNESADPDAPVSSGDLQERLLAEIVLSDAAHATLQWTIPAEVDGHNVDLVVLDGDERVAFGFIAVGDAPPTMRILAASGPGGMEPDVESDEQETKAGEDASAAGVLAGIAALGAVLALRRK